jgi:hypothetical protein
MFQSLSLANPFFWGIKLSTQNIDQVLQVILLFFQDLVKLVCSFSPNTVDYNS